MGRGVTGLLALNAGPGAGLAGSTANLTRPCFRVNCNALDSLAILTCNNTLVPGGTWLQPQSILTLRMVISAVFTV